MLLKKILTDPTKMLTETRGDVDIILTPVRNKPKLFISQGFFYYMNGELYKNKFVYIRYEALLKRLNNINLCAICEYNYNSTNLLNEDLHIIDLLNLKFNTPYKNLQNIVNFNIYEGVKVQWEITIKKNYNIKMFNPMIQAQIRNFPDIESFIVRKSTDVNCLEKNKFESYIYYPKR